MQISLPLSEHRSLRERWFPNGEWALVLVLLLEVAIFSAIGENFFTAENFFEIVRLSVELGLLSLAMTPIIITGGIDLSVGSVLAVSGIVLGLVMSHDYSFWTGSLVAIFAGVACGFFNGYLISYLRLSPFVVTLGMLSIGRSLALAISNNKFFYQFGHDQKLLIEIGGGRTLGIANPVIILVVLTVFMGFVLRYTRWGRHLYAIGGNENAARLAGVPVDRLKLSVYVLSGFMTAISAILSVGWLGSVTNGIGIGYELRVIASTVIGGANLLGGEGGAYAAFIGAALIEVIRNSLLLAGVDPYWQGTFVGLFIILAVLLERLRGRKVDS
jgi:ribose transport system permease protein